MSWPAAEADLWGELVLALREARQQQGLSILELEERLGVCRNHLEKIENGMHRPNGFLLTVWAWALGFRLQLAPLDDTALEKGPPIRGRCRDRIRRRLPRSSPLTL
jgi:transcriptional regulator with XRE-family HTH domain